MTPTELTVLERITERLGVKPDAELGLTELSAETGVRPSTWRARIASDEAWRNAFYTVGKVYKTTMRRIWRAQDQLAR